jgi:hypothetical protein
MKTVRRYLTRDRFAWTDVLIMSTVLIAVTNASLPWIAGIAICLGGGLLTGAVTLLLRPRGGA